MPVKECLEFAGIKLAKRVVTNAKDSDPPSKVEIWWGFMKKRNAIVDARIYEKGVFLYSDSRPNSPPSIERESLNDLGIFVNSPPRYFISRIPILKTVIKTRLYWETE